jgi:general secretion pathway protein E
VVRIQELPQGREGIFKLLLMDDDIKSTILRTSDVNAIRKVGMERGMITLRRDGARKVIEGITTIEEMLPVFQDTAKRKTPAGEILQGF